MKQLIVAGSGIKTVSHITLETRNVITTSDKVLYLLNDNLMKEWVGKESKDSESLDEIYFSSNKRIDSYKEISKYIISEYYKYNKTCVLMYGHPTVFASSALWAVNKIRGKGGHAVILPAISSLDCLFADISIDPGDYGCYSADATDFLIYRRVFDVRSHLVLWQVASLGCFGQEKTKKLKVLSSYLIKYYPINHQVIIYEAAKYPSQKPRVEKVSLTEISAVTLNSISTLYIPPIKDSSVDIDMLKTLGMDANKFS